MNEKMRGAIFIAVGIFAIYQGFAIAHRRPGLPQVYLEFGLGALAIGIGLWRLTFKPKGGPAPEAGPESSQEPK